MKEYTLETQYPTGTTVEELTEKELAEKGIVIEAGFTEEISGKEDLLRVILPSATILIAAAVILFHLKKKR